MNRPIGVNGPERKSSEWKEKRRYDWGIRWHTLKPERSKEPRHEVVVFDEKILLRMYELGYLKGQAEKDARGICDIS